MLSCAMNGAAPLSPGFGEKHRSAVLLGVLFDVKKIKKIAFMFCDLAVFEKIVCFTSTTKGVLLGRFNEAKNLQKSTLLGVLDHYR